MPLAEHPPLGPQEAGQDWEARGPIPAGEQQGFTRVSPVLSSQESATLGLAPGSLWVSDPFCPSALGLVSDHGQERPPSSVCWAHRTGGCGRPARVSRGCGGRSARTARPHCGLSSPVLREGLHDPHHQAAPGAGHHAGLRLPLCRKCLGQAGRAGGPCWGGSSCPRPAQRRLLRSR